MSENNQTGIQFTHSCQSAICPSPTQTYNSAMSPIHVQINLAYKHRTKCFIRQTILTYNVFGHVLYDAVLIFKQLQKI